MELKLPTSLERAQNLLPFAAEPARLRPGHRLELLRDGREAYPAMLAAIAAARHYVHLETYIFEADRIGAIFAAALEERARAGIEVRVLVDGIGSFGLPARFQDELRAAGVQLAEFEPPMRRLRLRRWLRRDHRKILVVDGEHGFTGGLNVGNDYAPAEDGGGGWRDTHIKVEGPLVADLEHLFRTTWLTAGGDDFPARPRDADESVAVPGSELACALSIDLRGRRGLIRRHLVHAVRRARDEIRVATAYFVPDRALRRAFVAAAARGVDVRILVPGQSDLRSVQWAGEYSYTELLRGGVRIHLWQGAHMHAKTAVVDRGWSMIGSYNLDYVSLFLNMEIVVEVIGGATGESLARMFEDDLAQAPALDLEVWKRRPWWHKLRSWLLYRLRRIL